MKLIASKDFTLNDKYYFKNDEIIADDIDTIVKLNEKRIYSAFNLKRISKHKRRIKKDKNIK